MASVSFVGAFVLYGVAWIVLSMLLPRASTDPGALIPGAALVGITLAGMQAVSQLYLPNRLSRASELYGAIGATIVTLGWFFILGRAMVLAMVLNGVIHERFGSISQVVFSLPVVRLLPRKSAWIRRMFDLDGWRQQMSQSVDDQSFSRPSLRLATVCIDCADADAMADFYGRLLGLEVALREPDWVLMRDPAGGTGLSFQAEAEYREPVWPEQPGGQDKMLHLDIHVDDLDSAVAHALAVGRAAGRLPAPSGRARAARPCRPSVLPLPGLNARRE